MNASLFLLLLLDNGSPEAHGYTVTASGDPVSNVLNAASLPNGLSASGARQSNLEGGSSLPYNVSSAHDEVSNVR